MAFGGLRPAASSRAINRRPVLQLGVLVLELLQPSHLGRQQPVILLLPIEIGHLADAGGATNLRDQHAVIALLQNERLLSVREFGGLHRLPLLPAEGIRQRKTLAKNGRGFLASDQPRATT